MDANKLVNQVFFARRLWRFGKSANAIVTAGISAFEVKESFEEAVEAVTEIRNVSEVNARENALDETILKELAKYG